MKIIETYICLIPVVNNFVKVNMVRDKKGNSLYFMEINGAIEEIGQLYFESIRKID